MKICLICEGGYPYIIGGVSSWVHILIQSMREHDFIIYSIGPSSELRGKFKYKLPSNVSHVEEVFLDEMNQMEVGYGFKDIKMEPQYIEAFKNLILGNPLDWEVFITYVRRLKITNMMDLFMSRQFLSMLSELCSSHFKDMPFNEFFWTVRSMLLPILYLIVQDIPEADVYHSMSAGYAGVIGATGHMLYNKPYILTEHGIYAREREEEIIRATWVKGQFKDEWIYFFYSLAGLSYQVADKVLTLFYRNAQIEKELGCDENKIQIIPNGIDIDQYIDIERTREEDGTIYIGAIARVVPIKDIKTMISAFSQAKVQVPNIKLYIMGPTDEDEEYYNACVSMIRDFNISDVVFTGTVDIKEYIGNMDILLLSSISEGQPLAILEGFACKKPFITTKVGSCKELIYGKDDEFGEAGMVVPIMGDTQMADAMVKLVQNQSLREKMGQNGFNRVRYLYRLDTFINEYKKIYQDTKLGTV